MRIYDARTETPRNFFRLVSATDTAVTIEGIVKRQPKRGDRLVALNGLIFYFMNIIPAAGPPGSFRAVLQAGGF